MARLTTMCVKNLLMPVAMTKCKPVYNGREKAYTNERKVAGAGL